MFSICNFFFLDKLRKFTISDFPMQTHFGHILIIFFFFLCPLIDPPFDIVFQPTAWASAASTKTFQWSADRLEGVGKNKVNNVINVYPKCVCIGKSLMVNFLSPSKKKKYIYLEYLEILEMKISMNKLDLDPHVVFPHLYMELLDTNWETIFCHAWFSKAISFAKKCFPIYFHLS